jgi:hypothetical protein
MGWDAVLCMDMVKVNAILADQYPSLPLFYLPSSFSLSFSSLPLFIFSPSLYLLFLSPSPLPPSLSIHQYRSISLLPLKLYAFRRRSICASSKGRNHPEPQPKVNFFASAKLFLLLQIIKSFIKTFMLILRMKVLCRVELHMKNTVLDHL